MSKRRTKANDEVAAEEKKPKLDTFVRRQSSRTSTAKAQQLIKEQTQNDSEEDEPSDDEFVLPVDNNNKKSKAGGIQSVKSLPSSESSEDSDEGEEEEEDERPSKVKSTRKPRKPPVSRNKAAPAPKPSTSFPKISSISINPPTKSFRCVLSSDSDSDFENVPSVKPSTSKQEPKQVLKTDSESDLEDVQEKETNLQDLFPILTQLEMQAAPKASQNEQTENTGKSATLDVSQLLAMGETQEPVASTSKANKSKIKKSSSKKARAVVSDESDWEEVEHGEEQHHRPREDVEVKIETPNGMKKKKSKTLDMQAMIKRRINQIRREKQVELHKASLLCHISHGMVVNRTLNSPSVMAVALSILPSQHCYPPKQTDLKYLEKITTWFKQKIPVAEKDEDKDLTLVKLLEKSFVDKKAPSKKILVYMFVAMLRSLGVKTRLLISLQPIPLKLVLADTLSTKKEIKEETTESKKPASQKEEKAKKPQKEKPQAKKDSKSKKSTSNSKEKSSQPEPKSKKPKKGMESKYFSQSSSSASPEIEQKLKSLRGRKSNKYKEDSSEESEEELSPPKRTKRSVTSKQKSKQALSEDDDDAFKPQVIKVVRNSKIKVESRKVLSTDSERSNSPKNTKPAKFKVGNDFWAEVFVEMEEKWISVDVCNGKVHCVEHLNAKASTPVLYVMGFGQDQSVRDLTRRYCPQYHTTTRKQRVDQDWWEEAIVPFYGKKTPYDKEEEEQMERQLQDRPIPKTLSELKSHPLYVLKRHLLKFEGIYPPDAPPLGFFKDEPIFARECVFTLRSRETWLKEAKVVKPGETPYKVVKARPKYDRMSGQMLDGQPLEIFGPWQTGEYVPPVAVDGKVPRNEYGNVELFKPCMLPEGTVHLKISTLNKTARKLGIDCAPAMVGFDFHCGGCHPVFEGFVICQEFKDTLLDAHRQEEEEKAKRADEKRLKRIYGNWKKLVNGLMIRERLMKKYDFSTVAGKSKKSKSQGETSKASSKAAKPQKKGS